MINQILKYPRTRHLEGSREQMGDEDLKCIAFGEIRGKYLVLEEKVDGANCGISFDPLGKMLLQSRGHYLNGAFPGTLAQGRTARPPAALEVVR